MIGFSEPIFNAMIAALAALGGLAALNGWQVRNERTQLQRYHDLALAAQREGRDRGAFSGHQVMQAVEFLVRGVSRRDSTSSGAAEWTEAAWGHAAMKGLWFCLGLVVALAWIEASSASWTWTTHPPPEFWALAVVVLLAVAIVVAVVRIRRDSLREERASLNRLQAELRSDDVKQTRPLGEIPLPAIAMEYPLVICQLAESEKPTSVGNDVIDRKLTDLQLQLTGRLLEDIRHGRAGPSFPTDQEIYWKNWIALVEELVRVLPDLAWAQSLVGRAHLWHSRRLGRSALGLRHLAAARHHLLLANPRHDPVAAAALARVLEIDDAPDDEVDRYLDVLCSSLAMNGLEDFHWLITAWAVPRRRDRQQRIVDVCRENTDRDAFEHEQFLKHGISSTAWLSPAMHILLAIERHLERVVAEENGSPASTDDTGATALRRVVRSARIGSADGPAAVVPLLVTRAGWTPGQRLDGEAFGVEVEQVFSEREWTERQLDLYGLAGLPLLLVAKPDFKSFGAYRFVDGEWQIDLGTTLLQSITLDDRLGCDDIFRGPALADEQERV